MKTSISIKDSSYAVYGLGLSGRSTLNFLKKKNVKKIYSWDDKKNKNNKKKFNLFKKSLDVVDYIVVSPGINIQKTKFKLTLSRNNKKIITDLDLFFMQKIPVKSIVITGTNVKSTACKLTQHIFKTNGLDVQLGGNIGKPVLDLKIKKETVVIIEASSFQLSYTKFIKPTLAVILNITSDHLDWHKTIKNYKNSKLKIFSKQDNNDIALLKNRKIIELHQKNYFSKLKIIKKNTLNNAIRKKITNNYLISEPNIETLEFVSQISKIFKIKENFFLKGVNTFKGLPHRHEIFLKKNKITFINDSKATSFQEVSSNIIKSFIIGKNISYFKNKLTKKIKYKISFNLNNAIKDIFKELILKKNNVATVLLSPASASYDQFNNFADRGNQFKKIIKNYVKKFL